jgi:hypothetical protein
LQRARECGVEFLLRGGALSGGGTERSGGFGSGSFECGSLVLFNKSAHSDFEPMQHLLVVNYSGFERGSPLLLEASDSRDFLLGGGGSGEGGRLCFGGGGVKGGLEPLRELTVDHCSGVERGSPLLLEASDSRSFLLGGGGSGDGSGECSRLCFGGSVVKDSVEPLHELVVDHSGSVERCSLRLQLEASGSRDFVLGSGRGERRRVALLSGAKDSLEPLHDLVFVSYSGVERGSLCHGSHCRHLRALLLERSGRLSPMVVKSDLRSLHVKANYTSNNTICVQGEVS